MRNGFLFISLFMAVGCSGLFVKPSSDDTSKPSPGPTPILKHAPASDVWEVMAQYVENKIITTPKELQEYVKGFITNGDLELGDSTKFDQQFKNASTDERMLTDADVVTIRSLK